ncbi:flippase-like domain-containing protein [bacterium]|nr:flippase-like domain-containing protein [candidate division CSSED10-310 bacterium]
MKRAINIGLGIVLSVALFYLFIKDVNQIPLSADSGNGHGSDSFRDRVLYVADVNNFEPGDVFHITSETVKEPIRCQIDTIQPGLPSQNKPFLVTTDTIPQELAMKDHPRIHFPRLQRALARANYWWLIPCLICTMIALMIRAYRWKFFFIEYSRIQFSSLWRSVCIGYMANNVLPFRIGEIVRAWFFGHKENRRTSEVFGTIVLERVFDILSILILYVAFVIYFASNNSDILLDWMVYGAYIMGIVAVGSLGALIALRFWTRPARIIINSIFRPFPARFGRKVNHMVDAFIEGLRIFDSWRCILSAFGLSMIIWIDLAVAYLFVFYAVDIHTSLFVSLFLIVALAFAVSIPSMPGFIGTFHFVGAQVLMRMNLSGNIEAYVLLAHLMAYIPVVILGFFYLSLENISWKEMRENAMKFASETGAAGS